jgi:hypothetical protein
LLKDTGFQGYEPKVHKTVQPKKSHARKNWPRKIKRTTAKFPRCVSASNMRSQASSGLDV